MCKVLLGSKHAVLSKIVEHFHSFIHLLVVPDNQITDFGLPHILALIASCMHLEEVDVSANQINPIMRAAVARVLLGPTSITTLMCGVYSLKIID